MCTIKHSLTLQYSVGRWQCLFPGLCIKRTWNRQSDGQHHLVNPRICERRLNTGSPILETRFAAGLDSSQPAGALVINSIVAGCHYFPPGPRLPSELHPITAVWPISNYCARWLTKTYGPDVQLACYWNIVRESRATPHCAMATHADKKCCRYAVFVTYYGVRQFRLKFVTNFTRYKCRLCALQCV